jgi:hypothetical protein
MELVWLVEIKQFWCYYIPNYSKFKLNSVTLYLESVPREYSNDTHIDHVYFYNQKLKNLKLSILLKIDKLSTFSLSIQMFIYNRFEKKFRMGYKRLKEKLFACIKRKFKSNS